MRKFKGITPLSVIFTLIGVLLLASCPPPAGDAIAPTVSSTVPSDTAADVAVNSDIAATFSEAMQASTITAATFTLSSPSGPVAGAVTSSGSVASFNPDADLAYSTVYTATIGVGATDLAGNALAAAKSWIFTTGTMSDTVRPTVITTNPLNGASGFPVTNDITATFSEEMNPAKIIDTTFTVTNGQTMVAGVVTYAGMVASFNPNSALAYDTVYTATVFPCVADLADNHMDAPYIWTFTTGSAADTSAPTVVSTVPLNAAVDVAVNGNITATFNEAMAAATLNTATFTLASGAGAVAGAVTYTGTVATFNPSADLAYSTLYTATITTAVTDLAGNHLASAKAWTFTTGVMADTTAPTVVSTIPLNSASGVAVNNDVTATFSEAMEASTINVSSFTLSSGAGAVAGAVTYSGTVAVFNPGANLAYSTLYTATIAAAATDLAGNAMAVSKVWTFTTGTAPDTTAPTVVSTVPLNSATGVSITDNVTAVFSETMAAATISSSSFTLANGATAIPGVVTYSGTTATFNPTSSLAYSTLYTATITTAVTDLAGNAMATVKAWSFTTGTMPDTVAPTVVSTAPANGATGVAVNINITATFSEALSPSTVNAATFTLTSGAGAQAGVVTYSGLVATFNPNASLAYSTVYTATVGTGMTDLAGNALASAVSWSFTTGVAPDTTPPTVVSTVPANSATGVAVAADITATFSEAMNSLTISNATFTLSSGAGATAGVVSYAGLVATFNPNASLAYSTVYTATITAGVTDLADNALATAKIWTFTTGPAPDVTPPTIVGTSPTNGASAVAIGTDVTATFSEAMAPATISTSTFTLSSGAGAVAGAVSYSGLVATFNPTASLAYSTLYTATVSTGVTDLAGNGMATARVWTFTTGPAPDTTPPTVVSTAPIDGATGVAIAADVTATFSEAMAPATISTTTFTLYAGATPIAGAVSYSGLVATFNPTASLAYSTLYTATVTTGATDLAANHMAANHVWTFTTGIAPDTTPPTIVSTVPVDTAIGVAITTDVTATFSEAMAPATISTTTFTLTSGAGAVAGAVSYSGLVATFNPTASLLYNTLYTATVTTGVTDLAGNHMAANYVWTFTTAVGASGPAAVLLGSAGTYVILAKSAISTVPASVITGDVGLSPAAESFMTGFSETLVGTYATSPQVTGNLYAADMDPPTPANMTAAITAMEAAYTDAATRPTPDHLDLGGGTLSGNSLSPGLYKWGTTLNITTAINLVGGGGSDDVWIFQVSGDLILSNGTAMSLSGGALAKNIFWQVAGTATLGTTSHTEGTILSQTSITFGTGATMNGRAFAQTNVALDQAVVTQPAF
jgi:hypothetical protein